MFQMLESHGGTLETSAVAAHFAAYRTGLGQKRLDEVGCGEHKEHNGLLLVSQTSGGDNRVLEGGTSPIVILDWIQWGLITISGVMPLEVKGRSTRGTMATTVPFCPCRELNLSPTCGIL